MTNRNGAAPVSRINAHGRPVPAARYELFVEQEKLAVCRLHSIGVLVLVSFAASLIGAGLCPAEVTEAFDKSADPFPGEGYGNWRMSSSEGAARVAEGVLETRRTERPNETSFVWAFRTSRELFNAANLLEKFAKGFTVAVDIGGPQDSSSILAGISIGNIAALPYVGYDGFRWRDLAGETYLGKLIPLGWTPGVAAAPRQRLLVHVQPADTDYKLAVAVTEGANVFHTLKTFSRAQVGVLDKIGLYFRSAAGGGTGLFDNFAVSALDPALMAALEAQARRPKIVPLPEKMELATGTFSLTPETVIVVAGDARRAGQYLAWLLRRPTAYELPIRDAAPDAQTANCIVLRTDSAKEHLGAEGYELTIAPDRIVIEAATDAGAFYGVQTLRQILPAAVESEFPTVNVDWTAPCLHIVDKPRYSWRGIMLNPGFNFLTKDFVKRYLDAMACYKLNRLHLHLADAGWALEIKKYPKLTDLSNRRPITERWRNTYGKCTHGFYTQEEMREIIAYAAERHIVIVPEIEVPGHATGAIACYPELACPTWPEKTENPHTYMSYPCVFCAGNDKAFAFLEDVFSELIDLFPSPWIHVGADEVRKDHWAKCPLCQARMKAEGLNDVDELQSYFVKRIAAFVNSKGRKVIGWTEILDGGLPPGATVQSWLSPDHKKYGDATATVAAAGNDVIASTHSSCYLNYVGLPLEKCYAFEPTPAGLAPEAAKHILGVEPCLWGFPQHRTDGLVFPRLCAFAEVGWSAQEARNWGDFKARLEPHGRRLDEIGIDYHRDPAVW